MISKVLFFFLFLLILLSESYSISKKAGVSKMPKKNDKLYRIFINTRNEEMDKLIRTKLIRYFGSISNGGYAIIMSFLEPEHYHNLYNLEQSKLQNEVMRFRNEQLSQLDRENKLLSRRMNEMEKEIQKYKDKLEKKELSK
jgi:hypothetical protein